jgi:hypothetical protein
MATVRAPMPRRRPRHNKRNKRQRHGFAHGERAFTVRRSPFEDVMIALADAVLTVHPQLAAFIVCGLPA